MAPPAPSNEREPLLQSNLPAGNATAVEDPDEAADDADADEPFADKELTSGELLRIMSGIWLGTFMAALDSTLIATLTGTISSEFDSLSLLSWLASGYFIANAALQPISGKLTDIFGRRAGLIFSNVFFFLGNLICGLARDEKTIIFGRVVAGMGGGGLNAISTFVGSDLVPLRRRGIWQGFGNLVFGCGSALGGVFGGFINDTIGWRWAFYLQLPLTVISFLLVVFTVKIPVKERKSGRWRRVDFLGSFTLVTTLVLLLLGLNSGGNIVPWSHPLVLVTLPLSAVSLAIFIYVESSVASEPVIPVKLLLHRTVLSACLTNWFTTMAHFAVFFYVPIYFQLRGSSATVAGAHLAPSSIGIGVGSIACGLIMRKTGRYYYLSVGVQAIYVLSQGLIATFDLDTPEWPTFIYIFFLGIGYAGMLTVMLLALIAAVEHRHQAVISSASYAFRSTGSTIGITIASAVFQNILQSELWNRLGHREGAEKIIPMVRDRLDAIKDLPPRWKGDVMDVYMTALRGVFLTSLGLAALGALASLLMREHKLYSDLARRSSASN